MVQWHLKGKPFEVQMLAQEEAWGREGFGYWLEMGLGKTPLTLNEAMALYLQDMSDGIVAFTLNSFKHNWIVAAEKFGAKFNPYVWPKVPKRPQDIEPPYQVVVNYEAIRQPRTEEYFQEFMRIRGGTYLAADESIQMKGYKSEQSRAARRLGLEAKFTRALSGAPVSQDASDLWAQLIFIRQFRHMPYFAFRNTFCKFGGYMGKVVVDVKDPERLNGIIREVGFRALKQDWLDLPPKVFDTRSVDLNTEQTKMYRELQEDLITTINGVEVAPQMVISQLIKLQQVSSGFIIDGDRVTHRLASRPSKVDLVHEVLGQIDNKLIVVALYRESMKLLKEELEKYGVLVIEGGMSSEETAAVEYQFNNDKRIRVCLCQIKAAKYSFTLVGSVEAGLCHTMLFYENSFSLDDRKQIEDRNHRFGQLADSKTGSVLYLDLVCSPVERRAIAALARKEDVADAIMDARQELTDMVSP